MNVRLKIQILSSFFIVSDVFLVFILILFASIILMVLISKSSFENVDLSLLSPHLII
jgi:hypothetical protein